MHKNIVRLGEFARTKYEIVFSVFLAVLAYLYRYAEDMEYPGILYYFFLLIGLNFIVNRMARRREWVNLWSMEAVLCANVLIITGILLNSGGSDSYFWVLFFLPLFTASLMVDGLKLSLVLLLIISVLSLLHLRGEAGDVDFFVFSVKSALLVLVSVVLHKVGRAHRELENSIMEKRRKIALLSDKIIQKDFSAGRTARPDETNGIFLGLAHDLRNVISVISMTAQIMNEDKNNKNQDDIKKIMEASRLAGNMVSVAMNMAGRKKYEFARMNVKRVIEKSLEMLSHKARSKDIRLVLGGEEIPDAEMSEAHMQRIVINLALNAILSAPHGSEIRITTAFEDGNIVVRVEDEGPGFGPEILSGGAQAFKTTRGNEGGTGLGLYVSEEIIKKHGGELRLFNKSEKGGAVAEFTLPPAHAA